MARAQLCKAREQFLGGGADGGPARLRLSAGELAEIDFAIGAIEPDDQDKSRIKLIVLVLVHGSLHAVVAKRQLPARP